MQQTLTITKLLRDILFVSSLAGCGALSDETKFDIQMYGIAKTPAGATGDHDPQFQTYQVQSITLLGEETSILLDTASQVKIVDRPQILVTRTADDNIGKAYTGLTIVLGPTVIGGDNDESNLSFALTQTTLTLTQPITIKEGETKTFVVKASWENTMGGGVMSEPELVLTAQ